MPYSNFIEIGHITDGTPVTYGVVKPGPEDDEGVKFIRGGDVVNGKIKVTELRTITQKVSDQYKRTLLKGGELLVSLVGNPGEVAVVPGELAGANIARQVGLIRLNLEKFDPFFVQYYLMSPAGKSQLFSYSLGSVQKVINLKELKRVEIPDVPLDIQKQIVKVLKDIDDKIELNRQTNQTLEAIAQAIFKSWFVDFEPTRAKIAALEAGEDPERAAMAAISGKSVDVLDELPEETLAQLKATAALFPDKLVESELGEVPAGWGVARIDSCVDILNGFAFKSNDYVEEGIFVLRTKNFNQGVVERLNDDVFLPSEFLETHNKYLCEPFDYHLVMVGASVGDRGLIYPHQLPALRNQNMWCFRRKNKSFISQAYTKFMLDSIVEKSLGLASGSAREFFRKGDFGGQNICFGNELLQSSFQEIVMPLMEKQAQLSNENNWLESIRDSLLPKLLAGEFVLDSFLKEDVYA